MWAETVDFALPSADDDCSVLDGNGFRIKFSQEDGFPSRMAFTLRRSFSPPVEKRARHRRLAHSARVIMQSELFEMKGGKSSSGHFIQRSLPRIVLGGNIKGVRTLTPYPS